MMTVRLLTYDGRQYLMPTLLTWTVRRTGSVPADELEAEAVYDGELQEILPDVNRFAAYQDDTLILRGVVDEYEVEASEEGLLLRVAGRGMAALLLDNEAEAATYQQATTAEIVRTHVTAWGVACSRWRDMDAMNYRVTSGSSQWKALADFTSRAGGFIPWFTPEGELVVEPMAGSGERRIIDGTAPVLSCLRREKRYGVISQVLIRDRNQRVMQTVDNTEFLRRGGARRQVLYMPGSSSYDAVRYTGDYQIQQSRKGTRQTELTLSGPFSAAPGDIVELSSEPLDLYGTYDVVEAVTSGGAGGETTILTMEER